MSNKAQPSDEKLITYAHKNNPSGCRFQQYACDPVPTWAVDIRDVEVENPEAIKKQRRLDAYGDTINLRGNYEFY